MDATFASANNTSMAGYTKWTHTFASANRTMDRRFELRVTMTTPQHTTPSNSITLLSLM